MIFVREENPEISRWRQNTVQNTVRKKNNKKNETNLAYSIKSFSNITISFFISILSNKLSKISILIIQIV